jgi:hypothetical protein
MIKVINGFNKLSLAEFSQRLNSIIDSMNGNHNFTELQAAVNALITEATNYQALALKALGRDKEAILSRDASREKITNMLHNLGYSVSSVADSNVEVLASSGFSYTQPKKPTPPLQKPDVPKLASGVNAGEIECKAATQKGMCAVNYYITSDAAALSAKTSEAWQITTYNKTKYTFSDLTPGQRYYIKVGLIGVRGQEVVSDSVPYIAQ